MNDRIGELRNKEGPMSAGEVAELKELFFTQLKHVRTLLLREARRSRILRQTLQEFVDRGCHHDLHPTMTSQDSANAHVFYTDYMKNMDTVVRDMAKATLEAAQDEKSIRQPVSGEENDS